MTTRLKHTDDDGDLSIFVSGDQVLFACNNGHVWTSRLLVALDSDSLPATGLVEGKTSPQPGAA